MDVKAPRSECSPLKRESKLPIRAPLEQRGGEEKGMALEIGEDIGEEIGEEGGGEMTGLERRGEER